MFEAASRISKGSNRQEALFLRFRVLVRLYALTRTRRALVPSRANGLHGTSISARLDNAKPFGLS